MLLEALDRLVELSRGSAKPHELPSDDRVKRVALGFDVKEFELANPPRKHKPSSLDEVIALANRFAEAGAKPVVWFDAEAVVLVIDDDAHRIELATLKLEESDVFERVVALRRKAEWHEQKPFQRLLRKDLAGTLQPFELLEKIKRVSFTQGNTTVGDISRKAESYSREVNASVDPLSELPEEVTLMVRIYKTWGETDPQPIVCAVDVDPLKGLFQLLPLPDQVERAQQAAVMDLGGRLRARLVDVPSYYGKP